jgi:prepilin-type processing-associated H-X9-DG protein
VLEKTPGRANLVVCLPGRGEAPALMLDGHVDAIPVTASEWTHDPFGAEVLDGMIRGRGTLDMKSGVAMFLAALHGVDERIPRGAMEFGTEAVYRVLTRCGATARPAARAARQG